MGKQNGKNKKNVKKTIFSIFLPTAIILAMILIDAYICNSSVRIIKEYNEMVMEMPIAPKPKYLIDEIVYNIIFACVVNAIAGFFIWIVIQKEFELDFYSEPSEYQIYLSGLIRKLNENGNGDKDEDKKDVIQRMLNNDKEITEYFEMSKKQEKKSYNISIFCSVFGFIMLVVAIIEVLYSARIEITVITVISGALTEVVSGLVLWIHGKSAEQLNHYYGALHENEKFLSAISLADKLEDTEKKEMYKEIIRAQIRANEENKENEK